MHDWKKNTWKVYYHELKSINQAKIQALDTVFKLFIAGVLHQNASWNWNLIPIFE